MSMTQSRAQAEMSVRAGTARETLRLQRVLQQLFEAQARDAASKVRLDDDAPLDTTRWEQAMAQALRPVTTQAFQSGLLAAAQRIQAAVGDRTSVAVSPVSADMRTYRPGNESIFGARKSLWVQQASSYRQRFVQKATGGTARPKFRAAFDLFNPRVLEAVDQATFHFCRETCQTATEKLETALDKLRAMFRAGLPAGDAQQLLARKVREIFASPQRAFMIAVTEGSRFTHQGQLFAARESGVVARKSWLASYDACELCLKLDGVEKELDEPFYVDPRGGYYARVMHPPRHVHCFCSMTEVIE